MKNPFISFSVAMVTPFSTNGNLYLEGIPSLVDYYKKHKVPAVLISGTTGEQHSMTVEERMALFHKVKKEAKNDLIIYGGVAAVQTNDAIALAITAEKVGLDGIMLGFPPYLRINQQEAFNYVSKICSVTHLPIMIYNNPPRTGFDLHVETLIKLVEKFPQIVAFKEAGDVSSVPILKKKLGPEFIVLSGFDTNIFEDAELGYNGITSILGNIFPEEIHDIIKNLQAGDEEKGQNQFSKLLPYMHLIIEMGTLRTIKYLLEKRNIQVGICRVPLSTLSIEEKKIIDSFFSVILK
ncbi:dihydrodipicolinate synthase family protein [Bacillus cereus]|uniref:dihydrodipicolinate synthase family protein n=1 Tax=Bacillus cereus TaxID=1396 RepID=UPI001419E17D|nr:dihydrodipicolinate synthase family protein [Bacillus cereus]